MTSGYQIEWHRNREYFPHHWETFTAHRWGVAIKHLKIPNDTSFVKYFCIQYNEIKWNENRHKEDKKGMNHSHTFFSRIYWVKLLVTTNENKTRTNLDSRYLINTENKHSFDNTTWYLYANLNFSCQMDGPYIN